MSTLARVQSVAAGLSLVVAGAAPTLAQHITRVSTSALGVEGGGDSELPSLSSDGRHVCFQSAARTLVPGDTNQKQDIFVRDRVTGQIERVSVDSSGAQANGHSRHARMSRNGRYVAFTSTATNLVPNDTNLTEDVFWHDRITGQTERMNVTVSGGEANHFSYYCAPSDDGRYVAFDSYAPNMQTSPGSNVYGDVWLRDRVSSTTTCVSVTPTGAEGNLSSSLPSLSADGRFVAFESNATDLVPGDTNARTDIFVRDMLLGVTTRVSVATNGNQGDDFSSLYVDSGLSADGRFVTFSSNSTNLVPGDTNAVSDAFIHELATGATTRVSVDGLGVESNGFSAFPVCSDDGRFVAFMSWGTNLAPGDFNGFKDIFVRDLRVGTTERVSTSDSGAEANDHNHFLFLSGDGRVVAFDSLAANLVADDDNDASDVFVSGRPVCTVVPYCTAGTSSHACVAAISSTGSASANASSSFVIDVTSVEGQKLGLFLYGTSGPDASPWATGSTSYLCASPPLQRTSALQSGGSAGQCDGHLSLDWNSFLASNPGALGAPFAFGDHVHVQAWYRDPLAVKTGNLSNALFFELCP